MDDRLSVFWARQRIGELRLDAAGRFVFEYAAGYEGPAISLSLPLRYGPFEPDRARPFFANLLPEADFRKAIAAQEGISAGNDFGLLARLGGDCAGALSLWPVGVEPPAGGPRQELTRQRLAAFLANRSRGPILLPKQGIRLSLAGAHDKVPVVLAGNRMYVEGGSRPSTHILKVPIPHWHHTVENEAFCMRLAADLGLQVAAGRIIPEIPALLIRRYDRISVGSGVVRRIHQEDFCQALGLLPVRKYEAEGGPGLAACFQLLERFGARPALDRSRLLRWAIFNVLIGNADAHAKNLSLLYEEGRALLAPFYDLLATRIYPRVTQRMAMQIGGQYEFRVEAAHWRRFADEAGIARRLVAEVLAELADAVPRTARALSQELPLSRHSATTIASIVTFIGRQGRHAANVAKKI